MLLHCNSEVNIRRTVWLLSSQNLVGKPYEEECCY